jgi:lipopolysaccharide export LptBFGC system permease protein LptF
VDFGTFKPLLTSLALPPLAPLLLALLGLLLAFKRRRGGLALAALSLVLLWLLSWHSRVAGAQCTAAVCTDLRSTT